MQRLGLGRQMRVGRGAATRRPVTPMTPINPRSRGAVRPFAAASFGRAALTPNNLVNRSVQSLYNIIASQKTRMSKDVWYFTVARTIDEYIEYLELLMLYSNRRTMNNYTVRMSRSIQARLAALYTRLAKEMRVGAKHGFMNRTVNAFPATVKTPTQAIAHLKKLGNSIQRRRY